MYYDDPLPWYKDGNIFFLVLILIIIAYGFLTGQIKPECLHVNCS